MTRHGIWFFVLVFSICLRAQLNSGTRPDSYSLQAGSPDSTSVNSDSSRHAYRDGIYFGESSAWTGMTVRVKVKNGKIEDVHIIKARGTPEYYEPVLKKMPAAIKKAGHVEVDGISGATLSSNALKAAVLDALKKAEIH
jgi:uncharacterized protein with FMN-binding domain